MNLLQTFLKSLFFSLKKKKEILQTSRKPLYKLLQTLRKSLFFFLKKKKRFYKLPRNLFTKKVLKKFKLALELPWRLFFWKLQKKKEILQTSRKPLHKLLQTFRKSLFFFWQKKKKEILQTSRKPLYKKGFKKVQVRTGAALAFILLETEAIYWKTYSSIQQQRYFSTMKTLFLWAK